MTTMVLQHKIPNSRELRLLRQDNLAFYAEINARAFSGAFMSEVPVQTYLRIIDEVKADFVSTSPDSDFSKPAQLYMDMMRGKYSSYDRQRSEPWIGTDTKRDTEVVVLLEHGSRALRILRDLDSEQSFLAVSSLSSLSERLVSTAAKLSGDTTQQIDALEARRDELDAQIATLRAHGATPMTSLERQTEIHSLLADISRIKAGFGEVPAAKRRINRENHDIFLETEKPTGQVLDIFWARQKEWDESGEKAVLSTLRDLHVDIAKVQTLQGSLEQIVQIGEDVISDYDRREITSFLPDMLGISNDISLEIANIFKAVHSYISNPNYAARREDARVLREAHAAAALIREKLMPSPRDTRLKNVGLKLTLPLRTNPVCDIKLTMEKPDKIDEDREITPVADEPDSDERRIALARETAKSTYLSTEQIVERITTAMGSRDEISLSDVLRQFPLRYGRHEISRYLAVASGTHPSILVQGMSFTVRFDERGKPTMANVVNPIFRRAGEVGEGFGDFATEDYLLAPSELRRTQASYEPIDRTAAAS